MNWFRSELPGTLVAFASAHAKRPLYQRDLLNAVCYPKDWTLRLTYRGKWIDDKLKRALALDHLRKRDILVVFCGDVNADTKEFGTVVPLRFGKVISSMASSQELTTDEIAVLRITLGDRPNFEFFKTGASLLTVPREDSGSYLTLVPPMPQAEGECDWSSLVQGICAAREMKDSRVFQLLERQRRWWQREPRPKVVASRTSDVTIWKVSAGKTYQLSFFIPEQSYHPDQGVPVQIDVRGEHLEIAEPVVHQRGSGAEVSYLLVVQRKYAAELATLVARPGPSVEQGATTTQAGAVPEKRIAPEFQALLRISLPWYFWPLAIVLLTLGSLGLNMSPEVIKGLYPGVTNPGLWLVVAKSGGALALAIAAFWAFRRLPVKV